MEDGRAPTTMQRSRIRADARSGGGWNANGSGKKFVSERINVALRMIWRDVTVHRAIVILSAAKDDEYFNPP